jgi:hypothetical protein
MSIYSFAYCALPQDDSQDDTVNKSEAEPANKQVKIVAQNKSFKKDGIDLKPAPNKNGIDDKKALKQEVEEFEDEDQSVNENGADSKPAPKKEGVGR